MEQVLDNPEFLTKLRGKEHEAFARLVKDFHPQMLSVAGSIVGSEWADEVVQDAWVSIYQGLPEFEGRSSLRTWLFTIVRNEARTRLRKESRTVSLDDHDDGGDGLESWYDQVFNNNGRWREAPMDWGINSPDSLLQEEQLRQCIEYTLEQLKPRQRTVFMLRDLEQLELEDICNILELSNSNVRVLLHRARMKLLQVIDHYQETGEC